MLWNHDTGTAQRGSNKTIEESVRDGVDLSESEEKCEKLLGVVFQSNLKWNKHIQELELKLKTRLTGLRKIKCFISLKLRKIVAESIFQSILSYCIAVWGGAGKGEIEGLQVLQNQAARIVLNVPQRTSRVQLFKSLSWLSVNQLIAFQRLLAVYNIRRSKEPEYLADFLTRENFRKKIIIPKTNLSLLKKSFVFVGAELWNSLPQEIRFLENQQKFKTELRKWIALNVPLFQ